MTNQLGSLVGALVGFGLILGAGCSGDGDKNGHDDSIDTQGWTSQGVIVTFAEGNVPADYVGPLSEYESRYSDDVSSFHASWFDFGSGRILHYDGRVFVFDHLAPLREIESYYNDDYGYGHTWVFTNEACGVLVQLDSDMTAYWADQYEEVVQDIC